MRRTGTSQLSPLYPGYFPEFLIKYRGAPQSQRLCYREKRHQVLHSRRPDP